MLLAQLKLDAGDNQGAVTVLTELSHKVPTGPYAASIKGLLGDAYVQLGKPAEAAAAYEEAALATTLPNERAMLMSKLGRAWLAAGKNDKARETWAALAAQQANPALAAEARLRLGELLATAQKK